MATSVRFVQNPRGIAQMEREVDLSDHGERVEAAAKSMAPVLSGAYRDSIHAEDAALGVTVSSDVEYAMSIEANDGILARALDAAR